MSLPLSVSSQKDSFLTSTFLPTIPFRIFESGKRNNQKSKKPKNVSISISCSSPKIVRSPSLDKHVVKHNKIRFVQKLKILLLSKPKHYIPLHILSKCRSYLSLSSTPHSTISMIHRYPSIFELFSIPSPPTPLNATRSGYQLCVRLTPAAAALSTQESNLRSAMSITLATKLQKLLMLSSHHRLLLSKLVHLAPDLGLPPNFRSRLCNDHPDKFKIVDTSYGRALELVTWDPHLAKPLPSPDKKRGLIVDRPLKFKQLRLRRGLNVKRRHQDFLINFGELPDVCPYNTSLEELSKGSVEAEKRACSVVREVLGMMVEKRTLMDHLTHFRKEFGLPNKSRAMIVRHPELFYLSLKGLRDSVFLGEAFDEKGALLEKDETMVIKDQWFKLVREGKNIRREKRKISINKDNIVDHDVGVDEVNNNGADEDSYDDGFENLFESDSSDLEFYFDDDNDANIEFLGHEQDGGFWTADVDSVLSSVGGGSVEPW
ncbi:PORR domain-containing protein [Cephalotus follicularis]|uniref:PORR domain-containing protein n=1 Tax=Cephalotus follicularis TaxID=3775 RepID=A0A1Q3AVA9_CEPFO|nr:PORR domain-containing protein [Cephalotus follicularis]